MSTYAQQPDIENYIEGWTTSDSVALGRLIVRCERDIDTLIFPVNESLPPTQVISLTGATGGTFTVQWNGATPGTITEPYNLSPTQLATDLAALTNIGAGNVAVLGKAPVLTVLWSQIWAETYQGFNVPPLVVNGTGLVGGTVSAVTVPGRKVNPLTDLNENQALWLANATAAQVEYRTAMGEPFFVRSQYTSVKGPDFTTTGKLPTIGPKVKRELTNTGLLRVSGRAVAGSRRFGVGRGWPTY